VTSPSTPALVVGVDVGTSSTKGVLVDVGGRVLARATRLHEPARPAPGHAEADPQQVWQEVVAVLAELVAQADRPPAAVGVSAMGPCVVLTDGDGAPLRPMILYGVDVRSGAQIARLHAELGADEVLRRCGARLTSQAVGPKLAWVADHEPHVWARARRMFTASSWLVWRLTGAYRLDHASASQTAPLYDTVARDWYWPWADRVRGPVELPDLLWSGEVAGTVTPAAAGATGLAAGTPVVAGSIDAWAEAVSVGIDRPGDLMVMYGTTLFLLAATAGRRLHPLLWSPLGAGPGAHHLAAGMATSGAVTGWLRRLFGDPNYAELVREAENSGPGSRGLLMLPYFAGERTPRHDPDARGAVLGLSLDHGRGDLYRAALEATALGARHNIEVMRAAGATIGRAVAVGGGAQTRLWPQIVSDVTGVPQERTAQTVGASLGAAFLAAGTVADVSIAEWNPVVETVEPRRELAGLYDDLYGEYLALYEATAPLAHRLAARQRAAAC
jgi:xylulokinase